MEMVNGEMLAGISLVILAILFLFAGTVNEVWAIIIPGDFLILALGIAFITLGVITLKRKSAYTHKTSAEHH